MGYIETGLAILGAFTTLLTLIANATPSTKDDKVATRLQAFGNFVDRFGINFKKRK